MRCKKCGNNIDKNANFCDRCGEPVRKSNETVKKITLRCEHCGGVLEIDTNREVISCPFCGSKSIILDNDEVQIEKIRVNAYKEIELEKIKNQNNREEKKIRINKVKEFKNGKVSKILKIGLAISLILSCSNLIKGNIIACIVACIQMICCFGALCFGYQFIEFKNKKTYFALILLALLLIIPNVLLNKSVKIDLNDDFMSGDNEIEDIDWDVIDMKDLLPEPTSKKIKITHNDMSWLSIDVYGVTESYAYSYIHECETDYAYNIDPNKPTSTYFVAHNPEGYKINVWFIGEDKMSIDLYCPVEYEYYVIPAYATKEKLPSPQSDLGSFKWKYDDNFLLIVGNITKEQYKEYVDSCINSGFVVDSQEGKDFYNGKNERGFSISIGYAGYNKMTINFESPK